MRLKIFRSPLSLSIALPMASLVAIGLLIALADNPRLMILTLLNGLTLAALYFLVASGLSLVFGLLKIVNLAHGSLFLLGGYVGYSSAMMLNSWAAALIAGFVAPALLGAFLQAAVFRKLKGQDLRQTLITIGISIIMADLFLWHWGGETYQFDAPALLTGTVSLPLIQTYSTFRLVVLAIACAVGLALWILIHHSRIGMMIRAGVDDPAMLASTGVNVQLLFVFTFAMGAGLAGLGGVVSGTALSIAPGEDVRYLLGSLVVVLVGGMGSIGGAALGALLIGLAETFGQTFAPTYGVVFTFVIMVLVLAFRPKGLLGRAA